MVREPRQQAADPAKGADTSGGSDKRASDGDTDADKEGDESVKTCSASPDATLDSVNSSDATLVVKLHLDDSACGSMPYKESNVRVNLKDGAGDVVAAAVFDFAKKSIEFKDGEAEVSLAFNTQQYWRPVGQIDDGSSTSIVSIRSCRSSRRASVEKRRSSRSCSSSRVSVMRRGPRSNCENLLSALWI